jgi:signal transduction histidine kinase
LEFLIFASIILVNIGLAVVVWFYAAKSISRYFFSSFIVMQVLWLVANYILFGFGRDNFLFLTRLTIFFATFHAFFFFLFIYTFLETKDVLKRKIFFFLLPAFAIAAGLTLSPYVFTHVIINEAGEYVPQKGPAIGVFGGFVMACILLAFYSLWKKYKNSTGEEKLQCKFIGIGVVLTFILIISFSFLSVVLFDNINSVRFGHLYTLPFILATSYVMIRHRLFNLKLILAEGGVIFFVLINLFQLLSAREFDQITASIAVLIGSVLAGIFIIRGVQREVEQRQKIEQIAKDLAEANEHLRELDREKSEFVSIASHQLRTPLTAISGYASMLLEGSYGKFSKKVEEAINRIYQSSGRLVLIIEDFLDISKIEQGRMTYQFATVDMKGLLKGLVEEMEPRALEKNMTIILKIDDHGSFNATADFGKIRQVMSNLIDNAIKYGTVGNIDVALSRDTTKGKIYVSVQDTGIGISPQSMAKLFQKFSRAEGVKKIYTEGSGLGLYVAQEMIKAHHGRIWVESEGEGKGSTFHIELLAED